MLSGIRSKIGVRLLHIGNVLRKKTRISDKGERSCCKAWRKNRLSIQRVKPVPHNGSLSRVEWQIDGESLWFESHDVALSTRPEAFACLAFAAAAHHGRPVRFPEAVCGSLIENLETIDGIWSEWWNLPHGKFHALPTIANSPENPARGTGLFFTLGVDSFYTLITRPDVDVLIYVCGYDVKLAEADRLEKIEQSLRRIGAALGKRVILLRTNLCQHPVMKTINWERLHGAALAAAGHLLDDVIKNVVISSSFTTHQFEPWGTSWKTDIFWSSGRVTFEHYGEDLWRFEKLGKIVDLPFVQENLRTCWKHLTDDLNCGRCEKCTRTMLALCAYGRLEDFKGYPSLDALISNLRSTKFLPQYLWEAYKGFLNYGLSAELAFEVQSLIDRSRIDTP